MWILHVKFNSALPKTKEKEPLHLCIGIFHKSINSLYNKTYVFSSCNHRKHTLWTSEHPFTLHYIHFVRFSIASRRETITEVNEWMVGVLVITEDFAGLFSSFIPYRTCISFPMSCVSTTFVETLLKTDTNSQSNRWNGLLEMFHIIQYKYTTHARAHSKLLSFTIFKP